MADRSPLSRRPKGAKGPALSFLLSISCRWKLSPLGGHVIGRKRGTVRAGGPTCALQTNGTIEWKITIVFRLVIESKYIV